MMLSIVSIVIRALQTLFGVTILGLSVSLYKEQYYGHAPVTTKYSIFLGAFAVILGFVGALSLFVEPIPAVVPMAFDAVGGLLLLAGGIAWAVGLGSISCNKAEAKNVANMLTNGLINGGTLKQGKNTFGVFRSGRSDSAAYSALKSNCNRARVDEIFQFLSVPCLLALILIGFLLMKKRGKTTFIA